ncbi:MAG: rubrerythrin [Cellulosilyticaceae bacterium]
MSNFKDSQTALNLMRAFAGESQARMRYDFYAKVARKEGLHEIDKIFTETSQNEFAHAHIFFKELTKELGHVSVPVNAEYPTGIAMTSQNLIFAADGEHDEHINVYPSFAQIAKDEGFVGVASKFTMIAEIEHHHEERFRCFANALGTGTLFKKTEDVYYRCIHCGHVHYGKEAPEICPNCLHPQGYFQVVPNPSK